MKKSAYVILALLAVFGMIMAGCDQSEPEPGPDTGPFTVTFISNGGSTVAPITEVEIDTTISPPDDPTRSGYDFDGWYKESTFDNLWSFTDDTVTKNTYLYAKWSEADEEPADLARAEKVTLGNAWYAAYRFVLPAGKTNEDYDGIEASYVLTEKALDNGVARGARLMGFYKANFFTFCMGAEDGLAPGKGVAVASYNTANGPYILDNTLAWAKEAPAGIGTLKENLETALGYAPIPGVWFKLSYKTDKSKKHSEYSDANYWGYEDVGPFYVALGLPGQGPSTDQGAYPNTFYMRDVKLKGINGTDDLVGIPLYFRYQDRIWPAYSGYFNTNGTAGHREASRANCDGTQPEPVDVTWAANLD